MEGVSSVLVVQYFGDVSISWENAAVRPPSKKALALVLYLAATGAGATRDHLAELLWGASDKRANVRQALYELRKQPGSNQWLQDDGDEITVVATPTIAMLRTELESGTYTETVRPAEFAAGFEQLSPAFDDWLLQQRERLERSVTIALRARLDSAVQNDEHAAVVAITEQLLLYAPYEEPLFQAAMQASAKLGDQQALLAWFHRAKRVFAEELDTELSPETLSLFTALRGRMERATAQLPKQSLAVLQLLYVASGDLTVQQLADAVQMPVFEFSEHVEKLTKRGFVRQGFVVTDSVVSELRDALSWSRRALLHERVVAVLPDNADNVLRAKHLLGSNQPEEAAPLLLQAGIEAVQQNRHEAATTLLFRALWAAAHSRKLQLRALLHLEGVTALRLDDPLHEVVLTLAEKLAWEEQNDESIAQTHLRRSRALIRKHAFGEALERALDALEIALRLGYESLIVQARSAVGGVHYYLGDLEGALASFQENLSATGDAERYSALNNVGLITAQLGQREQSLTYFEQALTLARKGERQPDIISTLNNLAATAERFAAYDRAARSMREGLSLARSIGAQDLEMRLQMNLVVVYTRQGELGPAWNTLGEVTHELANTEEASQRVRMYELAADLAQTTGGLTEAIAELDRALAIESDSVTDRHRVVLATMRTLAQYRLGQISATAMRTAVEQLEAAQVTDLTNWVWIEVAWYTSDPGTVAQFLTQLNEAALNPHQRTLVAAMRLLLAAPEEVAEYRQALADRAAELGATWELGADNPGPIVEWPLVAALYEHRTQGGLSAAFMQQFEAAVASQAQGLPKAVAKRYYSLRQEWLSRL